MKKYPAPIYLASPYSSPDPAVREVRFQAACRATAHLIRAGHAVFSPIVHSHPLTAFDLPIEWAFWERCDRAFLERCCRMVVLTLEGWRQSVGVQAEIRLAAELEKPVSYLDPNSVSDGTAAAVREPRRIVERDGCLRLK